jgi:pilus assembly protein Flp/PilA
MKLLNSFLRDEQGQDLVEYALLIGLIALVCVVTLQNAGNQIKNVWNSISSALGSAA